VSVHTDLLDKLLKSMASGLFSV